MQNLPFQASRHTIPRDPRVGGRETSRSMPEIFLEKELRAFHASSSTPLRSKSIFVPPSQDFTPPSPLRPSTSLTTPSRNDNYMRMNGGGGSAIGGNPKEMDRKLNSLGLYAH